MFLEEEITAIKKLNSFGIIPNTNPFRRMTISRFSYLLIIASLLNNFPSQKTK